MAQLFETLCMMLAFKESHSLAMHYCRLVWDVRSLSSIILAPSQPYDRCVIRVRTEVLHPMRSIGRME